MASFLYERHERKKSWKISSGFKLTFHQKWHSMVEAKVKIWPTRFQLDDAFQGLPKIFLLRCPNRNEAIYALTLSLFVTADQFKNFVFSSIACLLSPHQHMCNLNWDNRRLECHDFYVKLANRSLSNREGNILAKVTKYLFQW